MEIKTSKKESQEGIANFTWDESTERRRKEERNLKRLEE